MLYNVLIVEDDRTTADTLADQIRLLGHTVATTYSPRSAMQSLSEVIPDVIFMDINMPGVDGIEVVRFLRRDPTTAQVPVNIVTAEEAESIKHSALHAGANAYLLKPPTLEEIETTLKRVMKF
jgi:CheY-like chemotaxis protein